MQPPDVKPVKTREIGGIFGDSSVANTAIEGYAIPVKEHSVATVKQTTAVVNVTDQQIDQLGDKDVVHLSQLSKKMLGSVKASDADQFGVKLNELVAVAKGLDPSKMANPGLLGKITNMFGSAKEKMLAQYQTVETRMNTLIGEMDKTVANQTARVGELEEMYNSNYKTHEGLTAAETAGNALLFDLEKMIEDRRRTIDANSTSFDAQEVADLQSKADRLAKRIDDIVRAKQMAKITAPQIRLMQDNARTLAAKFKDMKAITIPAWQNTFTLYLLQLEQKKGAELANAVHDATEEAFNLQANLLRQNTQMIAQAKQRSVVSIETLQNVQSQLIGALDDMNRIAEEGKRARQEAEPKLKQMEQELISHFAPTQSAV